MNDSNAEGKWKSFRKGWIWAIIYFTTGLSFFLSELTFHGWTIFIILPFIVGLSAGFLPNRKYGAYIGLIAFFILLLLGRLEGIVCLFYTTPLAVVVILIGLFVSGILRRRSGKNSDKIKIWAFPVVLLISSTVIEYIIGKTKTEDCVSTKLYLPYSPEKVWDYIKSVDTLDTEKPFLLKIGLPVPQKCLLESESLGSKRVCYFEGGYIEEVVTEIKKPEILKMKVTKYKLQGRHWLSFKDAVYTFIPKDTGTIITRTTTYYSELKPRFYWRICEQDAIESEHVYVLNDLKRRLNLDK